MAGEGGNHFLNDSKGYSTTCRPNVHRTNDTRLGVKGEGSWWGLGKMKYLIIKNLRNLQKRILKGRTSGRGRREVKLNY